MTTIFKVRDSKREEVVLSESRILETSLEG